MYYNQKKKEQLLKELDKICSMEKKFPKGELRCAKNERRYKWFVKNQEETIYLSKKEKDLAEKPAVKKYNSYKKQELETALSACCAFKYFVPMNEKLKEWQSAPYEWCNKHEERKLIKTDATMNLCRMENCMVQPNPSSARKKTWIWRFIYKSRKPYLTMTESNFI